MYFNKMILLNLSRLYFIFDQFITYTYNNLEGVKNAEDKLRETTQNATDLLEKIKFLNDLNKLKKAIEALQKLNPV